jgi:ribosomal protein L7Ae-like RNA K-turn-binding protein
MTKGVVLIAANTANIDYVKQAYYLAKRIHKYMNVPVSIVTNSVEYVNKNFNDGVFDKLLK